MGDPQCYPEILSFLLSQFFMLPTTHLPKMNKPHHLAKAHQITTLSLCLQKLCCFTISLNLHINVPNLFSLTVSEKKHYTSLLLEEKKTTSGGGHLPLTAVINHDYSTEEIDCPNQISVNMFSLKLPCMNQNGTKALWFT